MGKGLHGGDLWCTINAHHAPTLALWLQLLQLGESLIVESSKFKDYVLTATFTCLLANQVVSLSLSLSVVRSLAVGPNDLNGSALSECFSRDLMWKRTASYVLKRRAVGLSRGVS